MFDSHCIVLLSVGLISLDHLYLFGSWELYDHMVGGGDHRECAEVQPSHDDVTCGGLVYDHEGRHLGGSVGCFL